MKLENHLNSFILLCNLFCSSYTYYYGIVSQDIINPGKTISNEFCIVPTVKREKMNHKKMKCISGKCASIYPTQNGSQASVLTSWGTG